MSEQLRNRGVGRVPSVVAIGNPRISLQPTSVGSVGSHQITKERGQNLEASWSVRNEGNLAGKVKLSLFLSGGSAVATSEVVDIDAAAVDAQGATLPARALIGLLWTVPDDHATGKYAYRVVMEEILANGSFKLIGDHPFDLTIKAKPPPIVTPSPSTKLVPVTAEPTITGLRSW